MKEFLRLVAEHYKAETDAQRPSDALAWTDYLFVFPNRRSGLFFQHYLLDEYHGRPVIAPAMASTNELYGRLSDTKLADRTELLFRLYGLYCQLSGSDESFDNFVFWGDMLLADFDDVDKYQVDARELFYNVRDMKEIDLEYADFDPEIVAVIRSFWTHFNPQHHDHKKETFQQTWSILFDLYTSLRKSLAEQNMAYEGMQMREVIERYVDAKVDDEEIETRLPFRKIVFVGLTAISKVDHKLLLWLRMRGLAEFCWDYADERLRDPASRAAYFTAANLADFPNVFTVEELTDTCVKDEDKEIELLAVSSGVGQTVQTRKELLRWISEGYINPDSKRKVDVDNAFHTAVVLPDEKLLIPMLYAVPEPLQPFNVTMGYSLKETPVAGLVDNLIRLQGEVRCSKEGIVTFYYKSVIALLSHNYVLAMCGAKASALSAKISRESLCQVPITLFADDPLLKAMFRKANDAADAARYLRELFDLFLQQAQQDAEQEDTDNAETDIDNAETDAETAAVNKAEEKSEPVFSAVEREFMFNYAQAVCRLEEVMSQYTYTFKPSTFFQLLQRLTVNMKVPFTGEPLSGLQVMGVLETRSLDFDNIIILSMNEGVFPAKPVNNTFIPMTLRQAFDLPTQKHRDAVFAYHFYRLMSRARRATLIYDTRSDGMQTGEMSRYLMQMKYLYPYHIHQIPVQYEIGISDSRPFRITKDAHVMAKLDMFRSGGSRWLSATAIKKYIDCPMKFFLAVVEGLNEDDEVNESIDSRHFGSVFHETMQLLYDPMRGRVVMSDYINDLLKDGNAIRRAICDSFKKVMLIDDVSGYNSLVAEIIYSYVCNVLKHDAQLCPFTYLASEWKQKLEVYPVTDSLQVRIKAVYDRIDIDRDHKLRIVDYKTGRSSMGGSYKTSKTQFSSVEGFFDSANKGCSEEAFQVMLYSLLLNYASDEEKAEIGLAHRYEPVVPHLYFIRDFHQSDISTALSYKASAQDDTPKIFKDGPIEDFSLYRRPFENKMKQCLEDIFDPSLSFGQCEDDSTCKYCPFIKICNR